MRLTVLVLSLLVAAGGCRSAPADAESASSPGEEAIVVGFRLLESGSYASAASAEAGTAREAQALVATAAETYGALWREHVGERSAPPAVDFGRESVVFLLLGQRSTGGWGIEPESVRAEGRRAEIGVHVRRPEPGGIVTMAFSAPFAVIAVERSGIDEVIVRDRRGEIVARGAAER